MGEARGHGLCPMGYKTAWPTAVPRGWPKLVWRPVGGGFPGLRGKAGEEGEHVKNQEWGLWVRTLDSLLEDQNSVSSTHVGLFITVCNYSTRDLTPGFHRYPHTCGIHTQIYICTYK